MRSAFDRRLKAVCTDRMTERICAIIFIMVLTAFSANTQAKKAPLCDRRYVVSLIAFAPWTIRQDGHLAGISHEIVAEIGKRTGCQFIESDDSFPKVADNLENGKSDIVMMVVEKSNIVGAHIYVPLYSNYREIVIAKNLYVPGKEMNQYIGDSKIKFAHIIGSWSILDQDQEKALLEAKRLIGVSGPEEGYNLLKANRVQALLFSRPVNTYYLKKLNLENEFVRVRDFKEEISIGPLISIRRTSVRERTELYKIFDELKKDGTLQRIFNKYIPEEKAKP